MGVIQSGVNQAVGAAGETIRDVKLLGKAGELTQGQQNIVEEQKQVAKNVLYTEEQKQKIRDEQLYNEEREKRIAKIREEVQREREKRMKGEVQSTKDRLRNLKDLRDRERLRKSVLGGDFNV